MDSKEFDQLLDEVSEQLDRITDQLNQKDLGAQGFETPLSSSLMQESQQAV